MYICGGVLWIMIMRWGGQRPSESNVAMPHSHTANDAPLALFTDACTRPLAMSRSRGNGSPSTASTALCIPYVVVVR